MSINYKPIGIVCSPFKEPENVPIQSVSAKRIKGKIIVNHEYVEGLKDLEAFSHLILLYHLNLVRNSSLLVKPFLDQNLHGIFATRAPCRPNPIGLSIVRLIGIEDNILHIQDLDIVDKTPLLDIKPYVPKFDVRRTNKIGWYSANLVKLKKTLDDGRFYREKK